MSPDIAMCKGDGCDRRKECYRFTAIPSMRQTYFAGKVRVGEDCPHFIPLEKRQDGNSNGQKAG